MTAPDESRVSQCSSECSQCSVDAGCAGEASVFSGWRLALRAAWVFLAPLAAAIVGAAIAGGGAVSQWIGAMAGFALGVVVTAGAGRLARGNTGTHEESS